MSRAFSVLTAVMLMGVVVATQRQFPPGYLDPAPILTAARQAIGTDNLRCVTIAGTAYTGAVGQHGNPRGTSTGPASTRSPTTRGR